MTSDIQRNVSVVPQPSRAKLNRSQATIYESDREEFIHWLHHDVVHSNGDKVGYAFSTVLRTATDTDLMHRWAWDNHGGFTTGINPKIGNEWLEQIRDENRSATDKAAKLKSLKRYYNWRDVDFEPTVTFSGDQASDTPQDWLTRDERTEVKQASLKLGTVPDFESLDPEGRGKWKHILAERFRMPKPQVGRSEFQKANGFKIPSIVWVSIDAGFRPIEVGRARVNWCDTDNARLLIPKDQDSKGNKNWSVVLKEDTNEILKKWLTERTTYPQYDDSDRLWLTREGRAYSSRTLNYLFDKLLAETDISTGRRDLSWYAMRHSTGTYMAIETDLKGAANQLRHSDTSTTERYRHQDDDSQRNSLKNIEE